MRWRSQVAERLRALLFGARVDAETSEEMRFHLDMETERLMREHGLGAAEARRQAAIAFGGVDRHASAVRDARDLGWLSGVSLDMKLGVRMLKKYPGLTLAGGLSLAIAVALAAAFFEFFNDMAYPRLPFPQGDRVVAVQTWDRATSEQERRMLHDFVQWRDEVTSIRHLSAMSLVESNVTTDDGRFTSLRVGRMTASALKVAGVAPLLGRVFEEADEVEGAPLPVLLAHDVWQDLFDGDRAVVGRTLWLGDQAGTVVGVMPEGFGFPLNQQLWVPLRERASTLEPRTGPPLMVMGRLAPGVRLEEAQAELATIGDRMAVAYPATHEHLRPRVLRVADVGGMGGIVRLINVPFILFLLVVCANVATLVLVRTATRAGEIAVRSALGASRRRLVLQLVAEALVLTSAAAAVGLAVAQWGLRHGMALFWEVQQMAPPYFFDDDLSATTILYVVVLAVLAATVIGGIPAVKATRRDLRPQLVQPGAGGGSMGFGRLSTAVIVVQVALCVAFLPVAVREGRDLLPERRTATSFPAEEFLMVRIALQTDAAAGADRRPDSDAPARAAALFGQVKQRLADQPGVAAAAFTSRLPGFNHPAERIQFESDTTQAHQVRAVAVDPDFFDVVEARLVAGRAFHPGEFESDAQPVIVDAGWARRELGGRNPVGERIRFHQRRDGDAAPWHEIVGVVDGMPRAIGPGSYVALYQPLRPGRHASLQVYLRTTTPPALLVRQVHTVVADVDPGLTAAEVKPLDEIWRPVLKADLFFFGALNVAALIILLFALVGIYALLSFTVAQRAREIAIRAALGSDPRRIIVSIFARAVAQIGLGVLIGGVLVSLAIARTPAGAGLVAGVAALMMLFGLAGCVLPARRALRIHPTDVLKAE
jgi:putative ABC transport system permease protein